MSPFAFSAIKFNSMVTARSTRSVTLREQYLIPLSRRRICLFRPRRHSAIEAFHTGAA